jgi:hypothetical protein
VVKTLGVLAIASLVVACKGNFQIVDDAGPTPDAPPDAAPVLSCKPPRFTMPGPMKRLAATATPRGYAVFLVDDVNTLRGYAYELDANNELIEKARDVEILTGVSGTVAAIPLDPSANDRAEMMLAVPCAPGSTTLIALDEQLRPVTSSLTQSPGITHDGWVGGAGSLVRTDANHLVFLATKDGTTEIYAKSVSRLGVDEDGGSPRKVTTGPQEPVSPMVARTSAGYLVVWNALNPTTPNEVHATVLDDQRNVATGATRISPDPVTVPSDADLPSVAYSPSSKVALFAWVMKTGRDHVWFSLRDEQLKEVATVTPTPEGNAPVIAAGANDFLVVSTDARGDQQLSAARIAADGSYSQPGIESTGGRGPAWDVVVRNGQQALIWYEQGSTTNYLWFDPACRN